MNTSLRAGSALAITVAVAYSVCTAVFLLWPEASMDFMNRLFHGLEFRSLRGGPALFEFAGFPYALAVLTAWAFATGALFGALFEWLGHPTTLFAHRRPT